MATAPITPLAWKPPYAVGSGPKNGKKKKRQKKKGYLYVTTTALGFQGALYNMPIVLVVYKIPITLIVYYYNTSIIESL